MDEQAGPGVFFSNNHPGAGGAKGLGPLAEAAAAGDGAAAAGAARAQYSLPGILHFLQHEWARFEVERAQWEVERAELQFLKSLLKSLTPKSTQVSLRFSLIRPFRNLSILLLQVFRLDSKQGMQCFQCFLLEHYSFSLTVLQQHPLTQWRAEEKAQQAQIAFLQGERKGQENLKKDLVRRIKMLEYALKQERAKYHKLKYGTELNQGDMKPPSYDSDEGNETEVQPQQNSQLMWKQGRQLLR
ncbi:hypothetical protein STEG23_015340, partial [Scotinomys teguina]